MTNEELLAKINHFKVVPFDPLVDALRAVVELHKPTTNGIACTICDNPIDKLPAVYPCPTIQAIEGVING